MLAILAAPQSGAWRFLLLCYKKSAAGYFIRQ